MGTMPESTLLEGRNPGLPDLRVSRTRLLLSLQWRLWKRTLRGNTAILFSAALAAFYALIALSMGSFLMIQGVTQGPAEVVTAVIGGGVLGYLLLSVFLPSGEGQLHAAAFIMLPLQGRDLLAAKAIATLMQSRGVIAAFCSLVTTLVALGAVVSSGDWVLVPVVLLMMPLALLTALLLGELLASLLGSGGRASKERVGTYGALAFFLFIIGYVSFISADLGVEDFAVVGTALGWTPFGAAGGVFAALLDARWWVALAQLGIALATVFLGWLWWRHRLQQEFENPFEESRAEQPRRAVDRRSSILLPGVPTTPGGAVFSRALRYLRRDSRLLPSLLMVPMMGLFFLAQGVFGEPTQIYFGVVFVALIIATLAVNDFGYDGPAGWLHLVSGIPAHTQLLARHAASALPGLLGLAGYVVLMLIIAPDIGTAALVATAAVGLLFSALGIALLLSTFNPYPTSKPGTSPWGDKSGFSGAAFVAAFASLLLGWIPAAPGIALMVIGAVGGGGVLLFLGVVLVLLIPLACYVLVAWVCIRRVKTHRVEIHQKVRSWVN